MIEVPASYRNGNNARVTFKTRQFGIRRGGGSRLFEPPPCFAATMAGPQEQTR
jgi:hypothetical protein